MNISQQQLQTRLLPSIKKSERIHQKFQPIHARMAKIDEAITTIVDDEKETVNTAHKGDFIAVNQTSSKEQYVIPKAKFADLYQFSSSIDDVWNEYLPKGQVQAVEVDDDLLALLVVKAPFKIEAPWGETQRVEHGDYLIAPLPHLNEIYRIARSAFLQTYR